MWMVGPIGFTAPWLLTALIALPVLWLLLRAVPPAPVKRLFPGVALLIGLEDRDAEADRTPWWLLLLRLAAIAAMILGFAGPVLNPSATDGAGTDQPLVVFVDNGWAAAPDWSARMDAVGAALDQAAREGRRATVVLASDVPEAPQIQTAGEWVSRLPGLAPVAWDVPFTPALDWALSLPSSDVLWVSDGLARDGRGDLAAAFLAAGPLRVLEPPTPRYALKPAQYADGTVTIAGLRNRSGTGHIVPVTAFGPDPGGVERDLARLDLNFAPSANDASVELSLPPELRNRITRFAIDGVRSAGAVSLADDSLRRRRVGLVAAAAGREELQLLSPLHYLHNALEPTAELVAGAIADLIRAGPDVIIMADIATLAESDQRALAEWVAQGGLLVRFAGPRLAAADTGRGVEDVLLPVRLRAGGRVVGGAMSWGEPRALAPFPETSPFYRLAIPQEVAVTAQVLAEPNPDLAERTIAALADGTPLVTRKSLGDGQVVLFHVTANAEWSGLPLSGLFVQMLDRLAVSTRAGRPDAETLAGTEWLPVDEMDAFGTLSPADNRPAVSGTRLAGLASPDLPPGTYASDKRRLAVNVTGTDTRLAPAEWPSQVVPEWGGTRQERDLAGWLWLAALAALVLDIVAALALSGRLPALGRTAGVLLAALIAQPHDATAQDTAILDAAAEVTLAYVLTGESTVDAVAEAGLRGLSDELFRRTSVEPAPPVGVDLETDELVVYPLLYWPITETQHLPSADAYARLNAYLRAGGMVLFDTRDANVSGFGSNTTSTAAHLQALAAPLDVPPLEPVPDDHVLTRTFYLLSDFPGRYTGGAVWVEAAPADAERAEGMPFRNLNDGVTPVLIGGNDWAAAWAVDERGVPLFPVGRGLAGERQREIAYRFGVNLVMHVLTGNYKSDQVHVPALLERLGQ